MAVAKSPHGFIEVTPDLPRFRKECQELIARPICRHHGDAFSQCLLAPFPATHTCAIEKCENYAAYLVII